MSILNTIICNLLPDNRPITSLQVIEDVSKCPKNYVPISRTYDQDVDADLWRESGIFSRRQARYICVSKTEGSVDHFVETVRVIGEKETPPPGFATLPKTLDSESKSWRKKQIVYKLAHRDSIKEVVTDVILCSKSKHAPQEYVSAGDVNGLLLFYRKTTTTTAADSKAMDLITMGFGNLNKSGSGGGLYPSPRLNGSHNLQQPEYENLKNKSPAGFPVRPAPRPPAALPTTKSIFNTLGPNYSELDGVPFQLAAQLRKGDTYSLPQSLFAIDKVMALDYDFELERQVLCTTKSVHSKNPFFK